MKEEAEEQPRPLPPASFLLSPYDLPLPRTGGLLPLSRRTLVMGILNVTPDSFSDGGRFLAPEAAVEHALRLAAEGADIIDIGGESTRPGSLPVPPADQRQRILPVVAGLRRQSAVALSVDTTWRGVAEPALEAGADIVNDVSALRADGTLAALVRDRGAPVILMHMQGAPRDMQAQPAYGDVAAEVAAFLAERREAALRAGVAPRQIVLDPGFGFGKTPAHNLTLLARLDRIVALGSPVLVGASRKSTIGAVLDLPVEERLEGSLALAAVAVMNGARLLRVHDVKETVRVARMVEAVLERR